MQDKHITSGLNCGIEYIIWPTANKHNNTTNKNRLDPKKDYFRP